MPIQLGLQKIAIVLNKLTLPETKREVSIAFVYALRSFTDSMISCGQRCCEKLT